MTQQQTERERLAGLLEREARSYTSVGNQAQWADELRKAAALLRGDEPAKPDRYLEIWQEALMSSEHGDQAAAAVLRRHFEPPREVVEAASRFKLVAGTSSLSDDGRTMADFILKGDA